MMRALSPPAKPYLSAFRLPLLAGIAGLCLSTGAGAQIVPDGGTLTGVTAGPSGRPTVSIAPTTPGGVSHNTYSQFSVAPIGANLDNTGPRANIIVNQVTSSHRSYLLGLVEVIGSRAHVVIANPNGITVNGGSFINTGGVVLSGGTVRYDSVGAPIVPTGSGDILVTGAGLGGTMSTLQLAAARLKIDGPVINDHVGPNADISLLAGNSELTLDPTVSPVSTLNPLVKERRDLGGSSQEYLVDVTPNGFMKASRVRIAVSSKGAGVAFAGTGQSGIGAFSIDASGKISARGASITGESGVRLNGGSVEILNSPDRQSQIVSNAGPVTVLARSGNIDIHGVLTGDSQDDSDPDSNGAVTLSAAGDIKLLSENADRLAIVYGARGNVSVRAGGSLINHTGRILSNAVVSIRTGGTVENITDVIDVVNDGQPQITVQRKGFWLSWLFGKRRRVITTFDYGRLRIPNDRALIFGASVSIDTDDLINSGEISAADGSLAIDARQVYNIALWTGTLTLMKQCGIVCWAKGQTDINLAGGIMNAQYGLSIDASELVSNNGGTITAYGNLAITAPWVETRTAYLPTVFNRPAGLESFFVGPRAWIGWQPVGGHILAPIGTVTINSEMPVLVEGGFVEGGAGTTTPMGMNRLREFEQLGPANDRSIGLLRGYIP